MEREYFYTIDLRGNLYHDGTIVDDAEFIDYFYRQLRPNTTGTHPEYSFVSRCGRELNYTRALDTPVIFHHCEHGMLRYADTLTIEFSREKLRFSSEGILYHEAPIGVYGRLAPQLMMELSDSIKPFGNYYTYQAPTDKFPWVIEPLHLPDTIQLLRPRPGNYCAGCGQESTSGLYLSFVYDRSAYTAESWLIADQRLEGSLGIMHGGFVSLLLDEAMGKVLSGLGIKAPTGNLNVRFRRPTPLGKLLHIRGQFLENQGRKYFLKGEIRDEQGSLLAEAEGLFINMRRPEDN